MMGKEFIPYNEAKVAAWNEKVLGIKPKKVAAKKPAKPV